MIAEITWKVCRCNGDGSEDETREITDEREARNLYANWAENMRRYNDASVSLCKITRVSTVDTVATNLHYTKRTA